MADRELGRLGFLRYSVTHWPYRHFYTPEFLAPKNAAPAAQKESRPVREIRREPQPEVDESTFRPTTYYLGIADEPKEEPEPNPYDQWNYYATYWPSQEAGE